MLLLPARPPPQIQLFIQAGLDQARPSGGSLPIAPVPDPCGLSLLGLVLVLSVNVLPQQVVSLSVHSPGASDVLGPSLARASAQ